MATSKTSDSRVVVWSGALAVLVIAPLLFAWFMGWMPLGTDPRVQEILTLQAQASERFAGGGGPSNLMEATAAFASMMEIRQKTEALPEHLRPQVEQAAGDTFRNMFQARINRYFALPPDQRQAELDRQIDQQEMFRKAMEAGQAVAGALGGGPNTAGGGNATSQSARTPWSGRSEEDRNQWRKTRILDRTSPQERARFTEYIRALDARREQRGLTSGWPR
jgi:hypothetical protein